MVKKIQNITQMIQKSLQNIYVRERAVNNNYQLFFLPFDEQSLFSDNQRKSMDGRFVEASM